MLRRFNFTTISSAAISASLLIRFNIPSSGAITTTNTTSCTYSPANSYHTNANIGMGTGATQQTLNKTNKYMNTQTTAAPIQTACGRSFDPMTFQELLQTSTDPSWSAAIQRHLSTDKEYMQMLRTEGGGAMAIDNLVLKGLGGSDEEAMANLKQLLQNDRKAALSVCALQDAYVAIREKRDLQQTKTAAGVGQSGTAQAVRSMTSKQFGTGISD